MPLNKNTPEYKVFHEYLGEICSGLSGLPESITPLALDLRSARIIEPHSAIFARGIPPYECAKTIMTAALSHVAQFPEKFEDVIEKLRDHGLSGLAEDIQASLDDFSKEEKQKKTTRRRRCKPKSRRKSSRRKSSRRSGSQGSTPRNPVIRSIDLDSVADSNHSIADVARDVDIVSDVVDGDSVADGDIVNQSRPRFSLGTLKIKQQMKILIVGHNGSGKSSLINRMLAKDVATVGGTAHETAHDVVVKHRCEVGGVDVTIYDTRGLGDSSLTDKSTIDSIVDEIESIDIVLICHRLYDRADGIAKNEVKVLVDKMDDKLIDLSILVFTFGDEYQIRCDPVYDRRSGKLTNKSKEEIKEHMETQQCEIVGLFKDVMKENGISDEHADQVPSCITCGKRKKNGEQKELPTSDDWVNDLWELIEKRCKPEARPFVRSFRSKIFRFFFRKKW